MAFGFLFAGVALSLLLVVSGILLALVTCAVI